MIVEQFIVKNDKGAYLLLFPLSFKLSFLSYNCTLKAILSFLLLDFICRCKTFPLKLKVDNLEPYNLVHMTSCLVLFYLMGAAATWSVGFRLSLHQTLASWCLCVSVSTPSRCSTSPPAHLVKMCFCPWSTNSHMIFPLLLTSRSSKCWW